MEYDIKKISLRQHALILLFALIGVAVAINDFCLTLNEVNSAPLPRQEETAKTREPILPLPQSLDLDTAKVELGDKLYHDKRLSHDDSISCASCHDLKLGGTDQVPFSIGVNQALGGINSPTTFNSGFHFVQFWDGRALTLQEQAHGPVHNPIEMGSNWDEVIAKLSADPWYPKAFAAIYPDGINGENITDAIGIFEMSLITPNSRFDRYLLGDQQALEADEKEGYRLFKEFGCVSCHQGINIGGNMYQTIGVMENYFAHREVKDVDLGRYNVTKQNWNMYQFKVPTLRNIAITFPYLHDGSANTLEDVLKVMWNSQLGRDLSSEESRLIISFLKTLTGKYKGVQL